MRNATLVSACLALVALAGCSSLTAVLGGEPSASVKGARVASLSLDGIGMEYDVEIANPYPVPLPLANIGYALSTGASTFATGQANVAGAIPAQSAKTVQVPVNLGFGDLLELGGTVKPGSVVPYRADMTLSADLPGVGPVSLPFTREGELPVPAAPSLTVKSVDWKNQSLSGLDGTVRLGVTNPNAFGIDLSALQYALSVGGKSIAEGKAQPMSLAAGGASDLDIDVSLSTLKLGAAILNMASSGTASYAAEGAARMKTPWGELNVPLAGTRRE